MRRRAAKVDAVIIGFGWTGAIMAKTLTDAGLSVVAIERGPDRDTASDFAFPGIADELQYGIRGDLWQPLAHETVTIRHRGDQVAVPYRQYGSFVLGNGVGGAGVHWNGQQWRASPEDLRFRSHVVDRYGRNAIPDGMTIQDYPLTFEELEPHFDHFEKVAGVSGSAGNLRGRRTNAGNPFEGARSDEYPNPPFPDILSSKMFADAAREMGMSPFPMPSAMPSRPYTNPYGVRMAPCNLCGFCERFGCFLYSKASPQTTILPLIRDRPNLRIVANAQVTRILKTSDGKHAKAALYVDSDGTEIEQPADIVVLSAFQIHNVRLLLLSGIGVPYDPGTGIGQVGRNYAYQMVSSTSGFFGPDVEMNPFIGAGGGGQQVVDEFNSDHFDHSGLGFIGGSLVFAGATGGRPIEQMILPAETPRWGAEWKKATSEHYRHSLSIATMGAVMSYRDAYLDLDPTYRDRYGLPLLRMTFNWHENEYRLAAHANAKAEAIVKAMKPIALSNGLIRPGQDYDVRRYQSTHMTGGAIMGATPADSVVNRYSQSWDLPNLFVFGSSAFPQNIGYNPTGLLAALTYFSAEEIKRTYLRSQGRLVDA